MRGRDWREWSINQLSGHVGAEVENWRTVPWITQACKIKVTEGVGHLSGGAERKLNRSESTGRLCALCVKTYVSSRTWRRKRGSEWQAQKQGLERMEGRGTEGAERLVA